MSMTQPTPASQQKGFRKASETGKRSKKYNKPHMIIPDEDMEWVIDQSSPTQKLWKECWRSDPYGSRWMPLNTTLSKQSLRRAKRPLADAGLFIFKNELTVVGGEQIYEWWVKNLHGCRSSYWEIKQGEVGTQETTLEDDQGGQKMTTLVNHSVSRERRLVSEERHSVNKGNHSVIAPAYLNSLYERVSERLINVSGTLHKHLKGVYEEREGDKFLQFCLSKVAALGAATFDVHTHAGWIASHYEQYWYEFQAANAAKEKKSKLSSQKVQNTEASPRRKEAEDYWEEKNSQLASQKAQNTNISQCPESKDESSSQNEETVLDPISAGAPQKSAEKPPESGSTVDTSSEEKQAVLDPKTEGKPVGVDKDLIKNLKRQLTLRRNEQQQNLANAKPQQRKQRFGDQGELRKLEDNIRRKRVDDSLDPDVY